MSKIADPVYPPTFFDGDHWKEHPTYSVQDWRNEVANDDTRLGYAEWCLHRWENTVLSTREYAFDVTLIGAIRVNAKTPKEAAAKLRETICAATVNAGCWEDSGDPIVFEASIDGSVNLYEIDGVDPSSVGMVETRF